MAKGDAEMAALVAAVDGDVEFELAVGELLGKFRARRQRAIEDMEIAKLIPKGVLPCLERFGGSRRNLFYRAENGRELLREIMRESANEPVVACTEP
jgi:hypothetical protein